MQALRRKGVDARLVVFERERLHPEADLVIERPPGLWRRQPVQARALARLLPTTDIFHFYAGLTLVPKRLQFPILRVARKKSVFHFLGTDIRGKSREELAYGRLADAQIVGSYDAIRWVPEAQVVPPGIDLRGIQPVPPRSSGRVKVVHASLRRWQKGTDRIIEVCEKLPVELDIIEDLHHEDAFRRYASADIIIDQLVVGWYGVFAIESMALGKPVLSFLHEDAMAKTKDAFGVRVPIVPVTKEDLAEKLAWLIEDGDERLKLGAESRAYVEYVHGVDRVADCLIEIYSGL